MASTIPLVRRDADSITSVFAEFGLDVAVLEDDERAGDDGPVCEGRVPFGCGWRWSSRCALVRKRPIVNRDATRLPIRRKQTMLCLDLAAVPSIVSG
jgi:hypothetical protein